MRALILGAALLLSGCATLGPVSFPLEDMRIQSVGVEDARGSSSGTVVGPRLVLLARHSVRGVEAFEVVLSGGLTIPAKVAWKHETMDVAVIETETDIPVAPARVDCSPLQWGQAVAIVGNPMGAKQQLGIGHVATTDRFVADDEMNRIALQLPVVFGDSGAAVFDLSGAVRGVVSGFRHIPMGGMLGGMRIWTSTSVASPSHLFCADLIAAFPGMGS